MRRTACCSTSPAARICSAAKRRWRAISSRGWRGRAFTRAPRSPTRVGCAWAWRAMASTAVVPRGETGGGAAAAAARGAADRRRRPSPRSRRSGSSASPTCSTARARRSPRASASACVRRLDQALGRADEPITPRLPVPAAMAEQRFRRADRARGRRARHHRASGARTRPRAGAARRGRAAVRRSALFRTDGKVHRSRSAPARRCAMPRASAQLFAERLAVLGDACDPGFGYDMVRLSALVDRALRSGADRPRRLRPCGGAGASDRPARRALRAAPRDAAGAAGHAYSGICGRGGGGGASSLCASREASEVRSCGRRRITTGTPPPHRSPQRRTTRLHAARAPIASRLPRPVRPIRLFERPEPIEAIAEVPDGPPVQFSLAARAHAGRACRRPRAHRHGMVARRARPRADARLFPRRKPRGRARLALPRRRCSRPRDADRAGILHGLFA